LSFFILDFGFNKPKNKSKRASRGHNEGNIFYFSGIRRRAVYHCIKIGEKKGDINAEVQNRFNITPYSHQHTQRNTKTQKPPYKNNHSRKSPRQRKTTKKHYKMPLTTIANSNQTSKSSEAFGTGQNPEINRLTCKEKGTTQIARDAIENPGVPSFPKNPSTQRNQRVEALFNFLVNFLVERAAGLKPPIKEICRV